RRAAGFFDPRILPHPRPWLEQRLGALASLAHIFRKGEIAPMERRRRRLCCPTGRRFMAPRKRPWLIPSPAAGGNSIAPRKLLHRIPFRNLEITRLPLVRLTSAIYRPDSLTIQTQCHHHAGCPARGAGSPLSRRSRRYDHE